MVLSSTLQAGPIGRQARGGGTHPWRIETTFEDLTTAEAIDRLRLDSLRPLAKLIDPDAPTRKQDIVPFLTRKLAREDVVRRLYESLSDLGKAAVQEALKNPDGRLDSTRFHAKYGIRPERRNLEVAWRPGPAHAGGIGHPEGSPSDPGEVRARAPSAGDFQ